MNARNARNAIKFAAIFATKGIAFDAPDAAASITFTSFLETIHKNTIYILLLLSIHGDIMITVPVP
jgi:hypothetical protein